MANKYRIALEKRKAQQDLDHRFKLLIKKYDKELYWKVVKELEAN